MRQVKYCRIFQSIWTKKSRQALRETNTTSLCWERLDYFTCGHELLGNEICHFVWDVGLRMWEWIECSIYKSNRANITKWRTPLCLGLHWGWDLFSWAAVSSRLKTSAARRETSDRQTSVASKHEQLLFKLEKREERSLRKNCVTESHQGFRLSPRIQRWSSEATMQ